jgi:DNA polymerase-3 subunit epsilon
MATATMPETERVIRRFVPTITDLAPLRARGDLFGLTLDVEATDKRPEKALVIELALVPFTFTANGAITGVGRAQRWYDDPGIEIPEAITKITGITNEMVHRQRIDDGAVLELVNEATVVIAHNANYDRKVAEKRCSVFKHARFGCSYRDIKWRDEGYECAKLRCLFLEHLSLDFDSHGAEADAHATTHLLSTTTRSGLRVLHCVLDAVRKSWVRIHATGSPFAYKDVLKDRGYEWDPEYSYHDGRRTQKGVWHIDVPVGDDFVAEKEWLANNAMCGSPKSVQFDSRRRFSDRIGKG